MKILFAISIFMGCIAGFAQSSMEIKPLSFVNTTSDDIVCDVMNNELIVSTNNDQNVLNDYQWNEHPIFRMMSFERKESFSNFSHREKLFPFFSTRDEGTSCYSPEDSMLYFSSAENYGNSKGSHLKLFRVKHLANGWGEVEFLPFCKPDFDYAHPAFDHKTGLLVFSSNMPGGFGGMDIWYTYQVLTSWTSAVNLGLMVNSTGHEIFPSLFDGDIYYSSNGVVSGVGYDLFRAERDEQWKVSIQLAAPLNSPHNDMRIVFLNEYKGFITSDRPGGSGGDDVFLFEAKGEKQKTELFYNAVLSRNGNVIPFASVVIANDLEETVLSGKLDENGKISLADLPLYRKYKFAVVGLDRAMFSGTVLRLYDAHSNLIRELFLNADGFVEFELLPLNYDDLHFWPAIDRTLLSIHLDGELQTDNTEIIQAGEKITILDDRGEIVGIAYTEKGGAFNVAHLHPELGYTFKLSQESKATELVVFDNGKSITIPVLEEEAVYRRIKRSEAIELINENNEKVYISPNDIFIINRIYYSSNSSELSDEAIKQLALLVEIMRQNQSLNAELRAHSDSRGNSQSNLILSEKRALAAKQFLIENGISAERILASGKGESQLINHCKDGEICSDAQHAVNRRADIRLFKSEKIKE